MKTTPNILILLPFFLLTIIIVGWLVTRDHSFTLRAHEERIQKLEKFQYLLEDYLYIEQYHTEIPTTKNEGYKTKNK